MNATSPQAIWLSVADGLVPREFLDERLPAHARMQMPHFLRRNWNDADSVAARQAIIAEAGAASFEEWTGGPGVPPELALKQLREHLQDLMDHDSPSPALEQLRRAIYRAEFEAQELLVPLYSDVLPTLAAWRELGLQVWVWHPWTASLTHHLLNCTSESSLRSYIQACRELPDEVESEQLAQTAREAALAPDQVLVVSGDARFLAAARQAGLRGIELRREPEAESGVAQFISRLSEVPVRPDPGTRPGSTLSPSPGSRAGR
ncbi:MAG TPA: hypothetical protein PKD86_05315 [Gemmatales bacterium]|mgnify:CR=1 FL=1|nr:hypothetical protein [Gemmatales bacterium]